MSVMPTLVLRPALPDDEAFLRSMLYEAAFWRQDRSDRPRLDAALASPELTRYVDAWGRDGDRGIIAATPAEELGAAWYRRFSAAQPGYGFIDEDTPEVSIAVAHPHRGAGIGRALLAALVAQARVDGLPALSLSVEADNPARHLYQRAGFEAVVPRRTRRRSDPPDG